MRTPSLSSLATALMLAASLMAALVAPAPAQAEPTQVIIVRHAEKASAPADDPALSAAGQARADELSRVLQSVPVTTVITTHYRRTQDTAGPVAHRLGLKPVVIPTRKGDMPGHIQQVADAVRQASGVVLVVGHSNTVSGLVAALSSSRPVQLCETSFSHLFVLGAPSATAPALNLRYGAADEPTQAGCI